jgi:hypothetical protein
MPRVWDGRTVLTEPEALNSCNNPFLGAVASSAFHTGYRPGRTHQGHRPIPGETNCLTLIWAVLDLLITREAGVMDGGLVHASEEGTPQGSLCAAAHKEPCGVPVTSRVTAPSSITPARSIARKSFKT